MKNIEGLVWLHIGNQFHIDIHKHKKLHKIMYRSVLWEIPRTLSEHWENEYEKY